MGDRRGHSIMTPTRRRKPGAPNAFFFRNPIDDRTRSVSRLAPAFAHGQEVEEGAGVRWRPQPVPPPAYKPGRGLSWRASAPPQRAIATLTTTLRGVSRRQVLRAHGWTWTSMAGRHAVLFSFRLIDGISELLLLCSYYTPCNPLPGIFTVDTMTTHLTHRDGRIRSEPPPLSWLAAGI
jgi:hypothetical protein